MEHLPNRSNFMVRDLDIPIELLSHDLIGLSIGGKAILPNEPDQDKLKQYEPGKIFWRKYRGSSALFQDETPLEIFMDRANFIKRNLVTGKESSVPIEHVELSTEIRRARICSMTGRHLILVHYVDGFRTSSKIYVIDASWTKVLCDFIPRAQPTQDTTNQPFVIQYDACMLSGDTIISAGAIPEIITLNLYPIGKDFPSSSIVISGVSWFMMCGGHLFTHNKGKFLSAYDKNGQLVSHTSFSKDIHRTFLHNDILIVALTGHGGFKAIIARDPGTVAYASTVLLCDGHFRLDDAWRPMMTEDEKKANRFFHITSKLPLDLQMVLCNKLNKPGLQERMFIPKEELDSCLLSVLRK